MITTDVKRNDKRWKTSIKILFQLRSPAKNNVLQLQGNKW